GITPGPMLFQENAVLVGSIYITLFIGAILLVLIMFPLMGTFAKISKIPISILVPVVLMLAAVGSFALNNNLFDVWTLFIFGIVGYFLTKMNVPLAPFILGFFLGPIFESNFLRALSIAPWTDFFTRPIPLILIILTIAIVSFSIWQSKQVKSKSESGK